MRRATLKAFSPFLTPRFLKFCVVGASGVAVNLGIFGLLTAVGVQKNVASAFAIEASVLSNFLVNSAWTFQDRHRIGESFARRCGRYHVVSFVGALAQFLVFVAMNAGWARLGFAPVDWAPAEGKMQRWFVEPFVSPPPVGRLVYVSQLLGIAVATGWNFLLHFHWTWRVRRGSPTDE